MRGFILFITGCLITVSTSAHALPPSKCVEKVLDTQNFTGTISNVHEEDNSCYATIKLGEENWTAQIACGDRTHYNSLKGKIVNISYKLSQYWDEHEDECVRMEEIAKISPK